MVRGDFFTSPFFATRSSAGRFRARTKLSGLDLSTGRSPTGQNRSSVAPCVGQGVAGWSRKAKGMASAGAPWQGRVQHGENGTDELSHDAQSPIVRAREPTHQDVPAAASAQNQLANLASRFGRMTRRARRRDRWVCRRNGLRRATLTWQLDVDRRSCAAP